MLRDELGQAPPRSTGDEHQLRLDAREQPRRLFQCIRRVRTRLRGEIVLLVSNLERHGPRQHHPPQPGTERSQVRERVCRPGRIVEHSHEHVDGAAAPRTGGDLKRPDLLLVVGHGDGDVPRQERPEQDADRHERPGIVAASGNREGDGYAAGDPCGEEGGAEEWPRHGERRSDHGSALRRNG